MIELVELQKVSNHKTILDIESLVIPAGEIVAIVGPVDSGQETLFELLTGQSRPTAGRVRLVGIDPAANRAAFSRQVGVLFAQDNLYQRQSARENLQFQSRIRRLPKSRTEQVLTQVGLADHATIKAEKLPSSLLRRLAFGRAILHQPAVLILVDPFARCDDASITLLQKIMRQLAAKDTTLLILARDTSNLTALCDTIYRLDHGQIEEVIRPDKERRPAFPFMVPAKLEDKVALVDPADILYIVAQDDRAHLQTADSRLRTQFTLAELEKRLAPSGFFRAHRSYLVNLQHVMEVIPYTRDSFSLKLKDPAGTIIPLSKSAARELRELLDY